MPELPEAVVLKLPHPEPYMERTVAGPVRQPANRSLVFEELFKLNFNNLLRYAASMLEDVSAAEEVVQQVFCKMWEKNVVLTEIQSVNAYLYRSVHNACLNYLKRNQVRRAHHSGIRYAAQEGVQDTDRAALKELQDKIAGSINALPEQCRTIFQMSRFEHLKYREIADKLGISEKTVENQVGKALKTLKDKLKDYLPVFLLFMTFSTQII